MSAKHYENPTMLSKVTAKNVGDVFLRHTVVTVGYWKWLSAIIATAVLITFRFVRSFIHLFINGRSCVHSFVRSSVPFHSFYSSVFRFYASVVFVCIVRRFQIALSVLNSGYI